jgi:radical SAM-linked protein
MSETRQRWRLIVARDEAARSLTPREATAAWEEALRTSGLPLAETDGTTPRPRISFGAPVPVGMRAEREPIDVGLVERLRIHAVREAIERVLPTGHRLIDLYDVWPGLPTLAATVVAGDYRVRTEPLDDGPIDGVALGAAAAAVLDAPTLVRHREKGGGTVDIDVRPQLIDLRVAAQAPAGALELWMRLRLGGEGGVGRPEEIAAALGERIARTLVVREIVRERVVLTDGPA